MPDKRTNKEILLSIEKKINNILLLGKRKKKKEKEKRDFLLKIAMMDIEIAKMYPLFNPIKSLIGNANFSRKGGISKSDKK